MSIIRLVKNLELSAEETKEIKNNLLSWPIVAKEMSQWETPLEALKYLKVELETRGRMFYISRLYGRWRKLLPRDDWNHINNYLTEVHQHGKERSSD